MMSTKRRRLDGLMSSFKEQLKERGDLLSGIESAKSMVQNSDSCIENLKCQKHDWGDKLHKMRCELATQKEKLVLKQEELQKCTHLKNSAFSELYEAEKRVANLNEKLQSTRWSCCREDIKVVSSYHEKRRSLKALIAELV
jgi:chromosome segregation ATPase